MTGLRVGRSTVAVATAAFAAGLLTFPLLGTSPSVVRTIDAAPAAVVSSAADGFNRTLSGSFGSADTGGAWTLSGASSDFSVSGGWARMRVTKPGGGVAAWLGNLSARDVKTTTMFSLDRVPTGGGIYETLTARQSAASTYYGVRLRYLSSGSVTASLVRQSSGVQTTLATKTTGWAVAAGGRVRIELVATGASPTRLSTIVWRDGTTKPTTPLMTASDSTAGLQGAGSAGLLTYASASSTNPPLTLVDYMTAAGATAATSTTSVPVAVVSTGKPGAANTGVPDGTKLTVHQGDLIANVAGATYDSLDIRGFVKVTAPNVTIRRSIVRGGYATGNIGLITNASPTATNLLVEDSTLVPDHPSVWLDGLKGANFTARRVEAYGTVDTAKVHGNNVRIERSWFHDTRSFASDPNQGGGPTHNDGVQVLGGDNITIVGNNISVPLAQNAAIQVTQNYAPVSRLTITGNWLDGAGCTVNTNNAPRPSMTGVTLSSNRFGRNHRYTDCAVLSQPKVSLSVSANVWDDNNLPVRLRLNG